MKKPETKYNKRVQGALHEQRVRQYIEDKNYQVISMNYRCKLGEIDIIAKDQEYIVFIEVKFRSNNKMGYPRESVDWRKQQKIIKVAQWYLLSRGSLQFSCRFDVVEILGDELIHIENAFGI